MPRGRKPKALVVDENDILDIGEEFNSPNILIDEEYGINGKVYDYSLCHKRIATRTGKEEDKEKYGEDCIGKLIKFAVWDDIAFFSSLQGCYEKYIRVKNLSVVRSQKKLKDIAPIIKMEKEIQMTVLQSLRSLNLSEENSHTCELYDQIHILKQAIKEANQILAEADELHELIKEKRQIIIKDTVPKKHRTPKDENPD